MATEDDFQSGSSDEELEMTAADVLRKLEEVSFYLGGHICHLSCLVLLILVFNTRCEEFVSLCFIKLCILTVFNGIELWLTKSHL